jgi:hypothetical protein
MKSIYVSYLALAHALHSNTAFITEIDEKARYLLDMISIRHAQGKAMTVTDALAIDSIGSAATVHRKLNDLLRVGLIQQSYAGQNRRTKYLSPTPQADAYFASLGDVMVQLNDNPSLNCT